MYIEIGESTSPNLFKHPSGDGGKCGLVLSEMI